MKDPQIEKAELKQWAAQHRKEARELATRFKNPNTKNWGHLDGK